MANHPDRLNLFVRDLGYAYTLGVISFCERTARDTATQTLAANLTTVAGAIGEAVKDAYGAGGSDERIFFLKKAIRSLQSAMTLLLLLKDGAGVQRKRGEVLRVNDLLKESRDLIRTIEAALLILRKPGDAREPATGQEGAER